MTLRDLFTTALTALRRSMSRSMLTILGIVIGISSVMLMMSVGRSAEGLILNQVADLGSDLVFVEPSAGRHEGPPNPFIAQSLTLEDAKALRKSGWFSVVSPTLVTTVPVSRGEESAFAQVFGTDGSYLTIFPADVKSGRFLDESDVEVYARVAVLGTEIADDLFGQEDPVGRRIKVKGTSLRVVGVLGEQGSRFFQNLDKQIAMPVTTMQRDVMGVSFVSYISMNADTDIETAKEEARWVLRDEHNIDNPEGDQDEDDFFVSSQSDAEQTIGVVGTVLTVLLSSIAAVSLVVGGIGIMNIMLVSVTERTREIGLRKAVGARRVDILRQFLAEAILLTLLGGVLGVALGIGLSFLTGLVASHVLDGWRVHVPLSGMALGVGVSMLVGLLFGVSPARKAANLQPIEALRYE